MRFERVDSARLLVAAEPNANTDEGTLALLLVLLHLLDLASDVGEVLGHGALGARNSHFSCINRSLNCTHKTHDQIMFTESRRTYPHLGSKPSPSSTFASFCLYLLY